MKLRVNGIEYANFTRASCEVRLDALCRSFSFEAVAPEGRALPFKGGEACEVVVDGETVVTGHIEVVSVNYDASSHTIGVQGRSRSADLLDSSLDAVNDIRMDDLTLKGLIEAVIASLSLDLTVRDEVNPEAYNPAEDLAAPEPGENAFEFIEKYARKRQVLITDDARGNIVIASNSGQHAEGAVQHIIGAEDNNVLRSSFSYDTTGRYNAYRISSGLNPVALNLAGDTDLASLVNQNGGVFDSEIRAGRQLVLISETPFSNGNCESRAKWEADIRKARGLAYSAAVPGYRVGIDSGALWRPNRIYQIVDDFVGKVEPMLCNSVTFTYDANAGRETSLEFVGQKAYTLLLEPVQLGEVASNVTA